MILTGKAKEAFLRHEGQPEAWLKIMYMSKSNTVINAIIIDWLDSVGIYVETGVYPCQEDGNIYFCGSFFGTHGGWDDQEYYTSRQQATEKAIERAVELFNERSEK